MTRPLIQRWTTYRTDHGRGDPITQPAGTHQLYPDRVVAWIDHTAFTDSSQFPALVEAAQQTPRQLLTLVGPHHECTRVYRALHRWLDDTMPKQLRTPKKRTAARPGTYPRCGETSPRTGRPCQAAAGWGTDRVGEGPCAHHGGSVEMKEAARELVREEMGVIQRLAEKAATGEPITGQDRLNGAIAIRVALVELQRRKRNGQKL